MTTKITIFAHRNRSMLDKLEAIQARFEQVGVALTNPEIINNQSEFGKMSKEYRSLEKIVIPFKQYLKVLDNYNFAKESLNFLAIALSPSVLTSVSFRDISILI